MTKYFLVRVNSSFLHIVKYNADRKNENVILNWKYFVETDHCYDSNYFLLKPSISRNFCRDLVRVNVRNLDTEWSTKWLINLYDHQSTLLCVVMFYKNGKLQNLLCLYSQKLREINVQYLHRSNLHKKLIFSKNFVKATVSLH